jgi:hypothetical protein
MTQPNYLKVCVLLLGAALTTLSSAPSASHAQSGDTLYGVTAGNRLVTFNSNSPCTIAWSAPISGLQPRESLLGIDFRPANKKLYGLGSSSRLYVIDTTTGKASVVGSQPFSVTLSGSEFGFDFNPTVDRIRVVSNSGQNLRLHPDTGAVAATDKALNYKDAPQVKANVTGAAYSNPDTDPNTGTVLYDLDAAFDLLATQVPPNDGVLNIAGELRVGVTGLTGFDISSANVAYAALLRSGPGADADVDLDARTGGAVANPSDCGASRLVTLDLKTGAATDRGAIGTVSPLRALAVALR